MADKPSLRFPDGIEVQERPWMGAQDARTFARDPGPGNPRVPAAGASPEASSWQQSRAPRPAPTPTPAATAAPVPQTRAYRAGRTVGSVLRGATPLAALGAAATGSDTDTEQYAKRFGLENTQPGLLRDVGVRALGVASDIGDNLTLGLAGRYLFRDRQEQGDTPAAPAPAAPAPAAPATQAPAAPQAGAVRPTAQPTVRRVDGGSTPLFTNVTDEADNAALMGRGQPSLRNVVAADTLSARSSGAPVETQAQPQGAAPRASGSGFGLLDADYRRERSLRMDADQLKPGSRGALRAFYERQAQGDRLGSAERVAGMQDGTTRRGQDMELQGQRERMAGALSIKQAEMARDGRLRAATAALWQQAGGDPETFQNLAMQYGLTEAAKTGGDMAAAVQGRRQNASKAAVGRLESLAAGEDGKTDATRLARVRALANSVVPNFEAMDEDSQLAAWPRVLAAVNTVEGMNQLRDPTIGNMIGLSPDSPAKMTMPDLRGAKVTETGFFEGLTTPKVSKGDYKVTLKNGTVQYIPRESATENELELLKQQGATISNR